MNPTPTSTANAAPGVPPATPLRLPRQQHRVVADTLAHWQHSGQLDPATAQRLADSIAPMAFDWKRTARYAFVFAIVCLLIALSAAFADRWLRELFAAFFDAPDSAKCIGFSVVAAGLFRLALRLRARAPDKPYRNAAVMALGVAALAGAVGYLGVALDNGSGRVDLLFLLAAALYLALGAAFPSTLVWVFGLMALGGWLGARSGYMSGAGAYFLGMSHPLRFVIFGAVLTALALWAERWRARRAGRGDTLDGAPAWQRALLAQVPPTKVMGLLYLFIALWILSIFGAYENFSLWHERGLLELAHWAVLFAVVAAGALWHGLRHDDGVLRGFGITFLGINLYTRFFEYFWDTTHKAVFFAVLAASFWALGSRAEKIWQFGRRGAATSDTAP